MAELVGKDGPETIVPKEPGTIIPNDKLSLYQQMVDFLQKARNATDPMPAPSGSLLQDMVQGLPTALMGTGARVKLAPRTYGTPNATTVTTQMMAPNPTGMQFVRQPFTGHPARGAYPAIAAGQAASLAIPWDNTPEVVAAPSSAGPAEIGAVRAVPEMGAMPTGGEGGKGASSGTGTSGQASKKPAAKGTTSKREPTLPSSSKRNVPPSGHYEFGGRPPVGQPAQVGEGGREMFMPDRDLDDRQGPFNFNRASPDMNPGFFGNGGFSNFLERILGNRPSGPSANPGSPAALTPESLFGNSGGGFGNLFASALSGGKNPSGGIPSILSMLGGMKGFEEGGRPVPGEPAMVGEGGQEAFVPDSELPSWLYDAASTPTNPAAQKPEARGPLRAQARGREVSDWSRRDPDAEAAQTGQHWNDIYNDPSTVLDYLGTTGQIIGAAVKNAGPTRAEAAPAGGKKAVRTPMDAVREEQEFLASKGFYKGEIDGADGPETKKAREAYQKHLVDERERNAQERKEHELRVQEGASLATTKAAEAQTALAEAQIAKTKLEGEEATRKAEQRKKGEERLKEEEKNISTWQYLTRNYGPAVGAIAGAGLGALGRYGVVKGSNLISNKAANRAEEMYATKVKNPATGELESEAIKKTTTPDRIGRVNDFWAKGGAKEVPFTHAPNAPAGFEPNLKAPTAGSLYQPNKAKNLGIDVATPVVAGGGEMGWAEYNYADAKNAVQQALQAYNADSNEANVRALVEAKNKLAAWDFARNVGRGMIGGYPAGALKWQRNPTQPLTAPAEAEKLALEALYRKKTAPPKAKPEAKSETPSLAEMTTPVRPARVPRKPKKAAE